MQEEFDVQYGFVEPKWSYKEIRNLRDGPCSKNAWIQRLKHALPISLWLPKVRKSDLIKDVIAGITVGVLCIPQGLVYYFNK